MARTMTKEEHEQYLKVLERKNEELKNQSREDIIKFLHRVGYCDEKGNPIFPYKK